MRVRILSSSSRLYVGRWSGGGNSSIRIVELWRLLSSGLMSLQVDAGCTANQNARLGKTTS
jgi:hypothetical protein